MQSAQHALIFSGGSESKPLWLTGSFRKIAREILNLLISEEYEKIKTMLNSASSEAKESFFERQGDLILNYAVVNSNDTKALKIIMENIPATIVQKLLRRNDFEILKNLVSIEYSLDNYAFPNQTEEEIAQEVGLVREKLQLLSRVDNGLLKDFLEGHSHEKYMSESVMEMIKSAVIPKAGFPMQKA